MKIGLFGSIGERLGREIEVDAAGAASVAELRERLAKSYPDATDLFLSPTLKACIHDSMVGEDAPLAGVERVEFFPPLSGG